MGEPPLLAAYRGAREVGFAVIATTLVLISVFVPLVFLEGNIGRLFTEFALAIAAAVAFSSVTALTLSPMMCSSLLKKRTKTSGFAHWVNQKFKKIEQSYFNSLNTSIHQTGWMVVLVVVSIAALFQLAIARDRKNSY